ncbi:MAG: hypothetical protein QY325_08085 [Flavobacteriales bacterium]|nr:MAG: hypothetical protein QY325_08085 [Flavobacteriales bacterium]
MCRTPATALVLLHALSASAIEVNVQFLPATCGQCNGAAQAFVSGGTPPYSYAWSPSPPNGQGTPGISGLCPGQWSVLVTDAIGATATADLTIDGLPGLSPFLVAQQTLFACDGQCNGWATANEGSFGGTPPYSYDWQMMDPGLMGPGTVTFQGLCPGTTSITVIDSEGCLGLVQAMVDLGGPFYTTAGATPACGAAPDGTIYATGPGDNGIFRVQGLGFDSLYIQSGFPPFALGGVPAGEYTVSPLGWAPWSGGYLDLWCTVPAMVTVPALPEPCGTLTGLIYHDADQDCVLNNFDIRLPYRVFSIEPGEAFTISGGNGQFARNLPNGNFTIAQGPLTDEVAFCPASGSAAFSIDTGTPTAYVEFANLSTAPHDVSIHLTSSAARPGFPTQVWVTVSNNSAFPSGDVTVDLYFDPLLQDPNPAAPWSIGVIAPYQSVTLPFTADLPPDVGLVGNVLTYTATAGNTSSEPDLANNTATLNVTITASYDPNDKVGTSNSSGSTSQYFIGADAWIDYTVRFQNTGTDTAFTVVIRDEIEPDLDLLSLEILGASHEFTPSFGTARELVFTFTGIQLPDSTTDLPGSQGYVAFRMKPRPGLLPGDLIENAAAIFFDFNPPIITEPSVLVAEFSTGVWEERIPRIHASPSPASEWITVSADQVIDHIAVHAADGRMVQDLAVRADRARVDVMGLRDGPFLLVVTLSDGTTCSLKTLVLHD